MIQIFQSIIDKNGKNGSIVFFGGAGVSTESNIPDFRSADGIYKQKYKIPPEEILSHSYFVSHTEEFFEFYREKMLFPDALPNAAHFKLAQLEKAGKLGAVITQNIDGLHQKAGSSHVLELHGSVHRNFCTRCHKFYSLDYILKTEGIPLCSCGGIIKPDVVLYEEPLDNSVMREAALSIQAADTLIVAGTSLAVYPAAGLVQYFGGENLILINRDVTPIDRFATLALHEKIGEIMDKIKV